MKKKMVQMWVDPMFRSALIKKRVDEGYPDNVSFTADLATELDGLQMKKRKNDFKFF